MKTRTVVLVVVFGCGGLFVALVGACAGVLFLVYRNTDTTVSPKIDSLFAAIDEGTFGKTYLAETTPELKAALSKEKYEQIGLAVKTRLGALRSKTLTQFNAQQFNAESTLSVVYSALFEKGSGTIRATFKSVDGEWRLHGFFVESPEFLNDLATKKCPYCSEPNPAAAKFCASCGKAIADRDATEAPTTKAGTQAKQGMGMR